MASARFIRVAGAGLLLAAALQLFLFLAVRLFLIHGIYDWLGISLYNLKYTQAIISAAFIIGLIALVVAQENHLGWLGYLGFGAALAGELSALVGFFTGIALDGFGFLLLFIRLLLPQDPQHNGLSTLTSVISNGLWLTSLCLCVGLSLYGAASLRARHIQRWGAGALLALGLLQLPNVLLYVPFAPSRYATFPASVSNAFLTILWLIGLLSVLLWSILGVALLRYARA